MLLILYAIVILYLLLFRKRKKNAWLLAALIIAFLSITTIDYADLSNYGPLFNYYNSSFFSFNFSINNSIWALLCRIFYNIGFNYRGMVVCLIFTNYFILHKAAQNIECDENKFFALFLIFPSLIQLVQLKFFTAFSIVTLAYSILLLEKKKTVLIFILLVILASLVHSSTLLFLFLIFVKKDKMNKKIIFLISILLAILLSFNISFISEISKSFISAQQYERYVINTTTPSSMMWILMIFFSWLICYIFAFIINENECDSEKSGKNIILKKGVISINLLLLTLPLLLLDRNMHRFLEIGFVILYFMIAFVLKGKKLNNNNLGILMILSALLVIVMFIYTPYKTVLSPIFSYDGFINIWR